MVTVDFGHLQGRQVVSISNKWMPCDAMLQQAQETGQENLKLKLPDYGLGTGSSPATYSVLVRTSKAQAAGSKIGATYALFDAKLRQGKTSKRRNRPNND